MIFNGIRLQCEVSSRTLPKVAFSAGSLRSCHLWSRYIPAKTKNHIPTCITTRTSEENDHEAFAKIVSTDNKLKTVQAKISHNSAEFITASDRYLQLDRCQQIIKSDLSYFLQFRTIYKIWPLSANCVQTIVPHYLCADHCLTLSLCRPLSVTISVQTIVWHYLCADHCLTLN